MATAKTQAIDTYSNLPSIFSFNHCMMLSAGAFFNRFEDGEESPVDVVRHGIRGLQGFAKAGNAANGSGDDSGSGIGNIQQTESAFLHPDSTGLVVRFTLRMLDLAEALHSCASTEDQSVAKKISAAVHKFIAEAKSSDGLQEVSRRIARNIANGSFLWRNRSIAQSVRVTVKSGDDSFEFSALDIPLLAFGDYSVEEIRLSKAIAAGLCGDKYATLEVEAFVDMGMRGQIEVYPSQAYIEEKPSGFARPLYKLHADYRGVGTKSNPTTMHHVVTGQAALRDQKISNRLRTIDTWYKDYEITCKPLPIEPLGGSLEFMQSFRQKEDSIFALLNRLETIDPSSNDGMFVIASIIRGGLFNSSSKKAKKENAATAKAKKGTTPADEGAIPASANVDIETVEGA